MEGRPRRSPVQEFKNASNTLWNATRHNLMRACSFPPVALERALPASALIGRCPLQGKLDTGLHHCKSRFSPANRRVHPRDFRAKRSCHSKEETINGYNVVAEHVRSLHAFDRY
jgi:hypothetical protein